MLKNMYGF